MSELTPADQQAAEYLRHAITHREPQAGRLCTVTPCGRPAKSKGLCNGHYLQKWAGRPFSPLIADITSLDRFLLSVSPEPMSGCWLWSGWVSAATGYGGFYEGKTLLAHRWAYEHFVGPIPEGLHLDHLCRVRCCVNPRHLEPVTPAVNLARGFSPSALNSRKTHCMRGHLFDEANTRVDARGSRICRTCANAASRRSRAATPEPVQKVMREVAA